MNNIIRVTAKINNKSGIITEQRCYHREALVAPAIWHESPTQAKEQATLAR